MFAVIRHYHFNPKDSAEIDRRVREEFVPIVCFSLSAYNSVFSSNRYVRRAACVNRKSLIRMTGRALTTLVQRADAERDVY
jgi:hypothetical protein